MNETMNENDVMFRSDHNEEDLDRHEGNHERERQVEDINVTKNIVLYRNGDKYFPPKRVVVNKRHIRTWEAFLEELTRSLQPRSGAIRDVRTPFHGTRIRSLEDLTVNGRYVAVPKGEHMKLIDYANVIDVTIPLHQSKKESNRLKPIKSTVNHDIEKIESRINQKLYTRGIVINVYRNGDPFTRAIKIVLNQFEQKHMSILVRAIEERVLLPSNRPIRKLYTMTGEIIRFAKDVEDGLFYVAASNEPYYDIKYGQYLPVIRGGKVPSSRHKIKYLNHSPTPVTHRNNADSHPINEVTERSNYNSDRIKQKIANNKIQKKSNKENNPREEAALKIQASFRGYLMRNEIRIAEENNSVVPKIKYHYEPRKVKQTQENNARKEKVPKQVIYNQPSDRTENIPRQKERFNSKERNQGNETRRRNYRNEEHKEEKKNKNNSYPSKKEQFAATIIQAGFRGYLLRKQLSEKNSKPKVNRVIVQNKVVVKKENPQNKEKQQTKEKQPKKEEKQKPKANNKIRENAAIKIQSAFRAFKTRKILNKNEKKSERQKAAIFIQAGFRAYKTRKVVNKNDKKTEREKAAIIIQAGFRAYKTRKIVNKNDKKTEREKASIIIQAGFRGYITRKMIKNNDENSRKEKAAMKIQAGHRAFQTRKTLNKDIDEKNPKEKAAIIIQAGFRAYKTRNILKKNEMKRKKEEAAIKIQSGFKGFSTRQQIQKSKINEMKEKAAIKIQASYRGFQTRNIIKSGINARLHDKTAEEQASERNNAASKIQATFRGFKSRKEVER